MHSERRFHPRVDVDFNVTIVLPLNGQERVCKVSNISLSGLQLSVDKDCVDDIIKFCKHPPKFIVNFDNEKLQNIQARLVVNRRVSQQHYLIGLKFVGLSVQHLDALKSNFPFN